MRESDIISVLESIGLSKNECITYIDLIRTGKSSALDISKRTGIHRSNTYDLLEKLVKKGIITQTIENERKVFYPVKPSDLLNYHKQKEGELKEIIPELEKVQNKPRDVIKVSTSEGITYVKNILMHLLDCGDELYVHGTPKDAMEMLGGFLYEFHKERVERKIFLKRIHGIDSAKLVKEIDKIGYAESKYLPSYNSRISTNICGDKVVIILWDAPTSAIVIESKAVADAYRNDFIMLWNEAINISEESKSSTI